jgi:NAD(P)-dependent dehydrogenase (short-subunit alcohol dehydrogenase family)
MKRLQDRVAIITGSGQGMGLAIAKCLAREGARIVITDINDQTIAKAVEEIKTLGVDAMGVKMDVTNKEQIVAMAAEVADKWGRIDILVNNAGGGLNTPYKLDEIEEKHWDLVVNVNMKGTFFCSQAVLPHMVKRGTGAIVNISALAGHWRASLAGVQYTAAKAGVEGISRQLAYDWGPKGIRVNSLAPTVTMTGDRMQGLWDDKGEEERQHIVGQIPLRRLSTPEEIGAGVVFLASDEASYITGITLDVCGGRYLR